MALTNRTNTARYFVENRHVAWVVLIGTLAWGIYGYLEMPKRKDPEIPIRVCAVVAVWPAQPAERIEQLVTRRIEEKVAENGRVERIYSTVRTSVSVTLIVLDPDVEDVDREFDDIKIKLDQLQDLPEGTEPIRFLKDYRDASALMLTVASPVAQDVEIEIRAKSIKRTIEEMRAGTHGSRATFVIAFPFSVQPGAISRVLQAFPDWIERQGLGRDARLVEKDGFIAVDVDIEGNDSALREIMKRYIQARLATSDLHPDVWEVAVIRNIDETDDRLRDVAGPKYSYVELDEHSDLIARTFQSLPSVSKVTKYGVLQEAIYLTFSNERLAAYGIQPATVQQILKARNVVLPGGVTEVAQRNIVVVPHGGLEGEIDLKDVFIGASDRGLPVSIRDVFEVERSYETPRYLNFYTYKDESGKWRRTRAITLSVLMKSGHQIGEFGEQIDKALEELRARLPADLIIERTSDQPLQVNEIVALFTKSLFEAVILIVAVAFLGFREWRSALLMALSIPLTLAMTAGMMHLLRLDLQQVSIASLIISLGLLVDDPVVAGDAIKRELEAGQKPIVAAWLGPTKLARAIVYATATNIAAYLPLLLMKEDVGRFIFSLPVVITCSLVASRIVSMTFVPLLGYHLLKKRTERPPSKRFGRVYERLVGFAIEHRFWVLGGAAVLLVLAVLTSGKLRSSFFPKDLQYLFYIDVWLPEDATFSATQEAARKVEDIVREVAASVGRENPDEDGNPKEVLRSVTTFVGGGGPRFWVTLLQEMQQLNYAQVVVQVKDKRDTPILVGPLQRALSTRLPGLIADVRELETAMPVGIPVAVRIRGEDIGELRRLAEQVKKVFASIPTIERVRDDWGADTLTLNVNVDANRANLTGMTNLDATLSLISSTNGLPLTTILEKDRQIPVYARIRPDEKGSIEDIKGIYAFSTRSSQRVPLSHIASFEIGLQPEKIKRRNHFRTITVAGFPVEGKLPSEVMNEARSSIMKTPMPPGYIMEIAGEEEEQVKAFRQIAVVMAISILLIFFMLTLEFRNAVKPLIVFSAIPFGLIGAVASLGIANAPFGFMAFLGCASLVGVIVSHVIVLFDFIETSREQGQPLREALVSAGVIRLRPVLITVGSTVIGLVPLAKHGGPLWEPLCYAQMGGLTIATAITLVLVPVLYAIFVLDLKIVKWQPSNDELPTEP